ncbi:MAG: sugar phosphate isomerase/epimerase family protein [Thermoproteota archaeon]|jgi:hexulose-6-phosphate isomerase
MKKGINLWSLNWPNLTKELSNKELASKIKEIGYDGVELVFDDKYFDPTKKSREEVKEFADNFVLQGLEIPSVATGVFWKYNLGSNDESIRRKGIEYGKAGIRMANAAGAKSILVVPAVASPDIPYEKVYENSVRSIKELGSYAKDFGVTVAVENVWNKFLYSPMEFKRFIQEVGLENVRVYLDVANLMAIAYPENWIHTLKGMISNVHAKDFDVNVGNITGFRHLLKGSVDWKKIAKLLKDAGFNGFLTLECSPEFDPEVKEVTLEVALRKAKENCLALEEIIKSA